MLDGEDEATDIGYVLLKEPKSKKLWPRNLGGSTWMRRGSVDSNDSSIAVSNATMSPISRAP